MEYIMKMTAATVICAACIMSCISCVGRKGNDSQEAEGTAYAGLLDIRTLNGIHTVKILDPWKEGSFLDRYILIPEGMEKDSVIAAMPDGYRNWTIVRTPVRKAAVFTGLHCTMLDFLGAADRIGGVCEPQYIKTEYIKDGLEKGTVKDFGQAARPDFEKILENGTDAVFLSSFSDRSLSDRLRKAGITVIECADYMETHPLGRCEWIKFFGMLTGHEAKADSLFTVTDSLYRKTCMLTSGQKEKPSLLSEMKIGNVWYVPGGKSYTALMYRDAGGEYVWKDDTETGSLALSYETVLDKASDADVWIIKYNSDTDLTLSAMERTFEGYTGFKAFRQQNVYGCNAATSEYFEDLVTQPHLILEELGAIFHPELFPDHRFRYFRKLEEGK